MTPKVVDTRAFSHDYVNRWTRLRGLGEGLHGPFSPHIELRHVADQGDAFEPPGSVTAGVKRTAVEKVHQAVVANETRHVNIVQRFTRKKLQRFVFMPRCKRASFNETTCELFKCDL